VRAGHLAITGKEAPRSRGMPR